MPRPHLTYKNINPGTIAAAEQLFARKPWRLSPDEQIATAQEFVDKFITIYGIPEVYVEFGGDEPVNFVIPVPEDEDSLGDVPETGPIVLQLSHFSITNLFFGLRAYMNEQAGNPDIPEQCFAWALSLFYTIKPAMFRARVREGRITGVTAEQTFSRASWAKLVEHGFATSWGALTGSPEQWSAALSGEAVAETNAILSDPDAMAATHEAEAELDAEAPESPSEAPVERNGTNAVLTLNRDGLRAAAKDASIPGRGTMTADQLREALLAAGVWVAQ